LHEQLAKELPVDVMQELELKSNLHKVQLQQIQMLKNEILDTNNRSSIFEEENKKLEVKIIEKQQQYQQKEKTLMTTVRKLEFEISGWSSRILDSQENNSSVIQALNNEKGLYLTQVNYKRTDVGVDNQLV